MIREKKIGIPHVLVLILALALADYLLSPTYQKLILVYKNFKDRRTLEKLKDQDCIEFALSLDRIVSNEKTAKTKNWVSENWMFNIWDKPTHLGEGLPVGRMKCGATAIIIEKENDDYKILSPYDESIGWINKKQISFTFYQNPKTQKPCD
ncbi:MAG TPA: hypothetical protein DCG42_01505 [Maribacter sp.]|nr:hypothetical protein [Maribacter sp.]